MDREPHACVIGAPKSTIRDTVTVLHGLWNLLCLGPGTLHAVYWFAMDCPDAATLPSNDLALDDSVAMAVLWLPYWILRKYGYGQGFMTLKRGCPEFR